MDTTEHWQRVYSQKKPEEVSWYQPHLEKSLRLIESCGVPPNARIVDVGGGASTLVDDLILRGYTNLAVIDLAPAAIEVAQKRVAGLMSGAWPPQPSGAVAVPIDTHTEPTTTLPHVDWVVGDATTPLLPDASVDVWHDRAVFHFLTNESDRAAYLAQVARCVKPGGYVIVATFDKEGPERCSGLTVVRYDADEIHGVFGASYVKLGQEREQHETPFGTTQSFIYCFCRKED